MPQPRGLRTASQERQRAFWRGRYAEDPALFGDSESPFARWCLPFLRRETKLSGMIELGCGYGRDARFFARLGYRVQCVDLAGVTARPTDERLADPARYRCFDSDALEFLNRLPVGSADVVYSNMFFNMDFTESEHQQLFRAIHRALRPEGVHCFSARSTSDPWFGRGIPVGPDTFDLTPDGTTMHFISRKYADELGRNGFEPVERAEVAEGEGEFPIRLLYVVDRKKQR